MTDHLKTRPTPPVETEHTDQGEQVLMTGVPPICKRARLELMMAAPLVPSRIQKPCDIGLFDEAARRQLPLF